MITNIPPKGTKDWEPAEFRVRKHIFDKWRKVCQSFGYEEYLTPLVENAEIYRAKSGEDIGGKELTLITDRGGKEIAIRPEMTPSVTRMVSKEYGILPKPIRYFSIANFFRNEKPQRGRNREFWQLNFDLFGNESLESDLEILQMSIEIMLSFNPPSGSFNLNINNRKLINGFLQNILGLDDKEQVDIIRIFDKFEKLNSENFEKLLKGQGLDQQKVNKVNIFMNFKNIEEIEKSDLGLEENIGLKEIKYLISSLEKLGYGKYIKFNPSMIRGFDYYDGTIFEIFDNHPDNNRSMFGGGRYNSLSGIFSKNDFCAVGAAPGDEAMKLFLESWGLIDKISKESKLETYFIPLLEEEYNIDINKIAQKLRISGKNIEMGISKIKLNKALNYANKKQIEYIVIYGEQEKEKGIYTLKNMKTGENKEIKL